MADSKALAQAAYDVVSSKASNNALLQGISGAFGFMATIPADVLSIPMIYGSMWNEIRSIYGHSPAPLDAISTVLKKVVPELAVDLAFDKVMGNVPIVGIYFNAVCAKALTWRLGALFAFLSSRSTEVDGDEVERALTAIRDALPPGGMFKFTTPDRIVFNKIIEPSKPQAIEPPEVKFARVLEIEGTVTAEAVKRQHSILMTLYHPDLTQTLGKEIQEVALKKARELNEAFAYFQTKFDFR